MMTDHLLNFAKSRLFLHIVAITATTLATVMAYVLIPEITVPSPSNGLYIPVIGGNWVTGQGFGTGEIATENLVQMSSALSSGKTLVILGSSELQDTRLAQEPYRFLPQVKHVPVLAYGYSYLNSIGAYALLAANTAALSSKTKLVILLSPSWFWDPAPSNYVIANLQPQVLIRLYQNPGARNVINGYFQLHKDEFTSVSPTQEAFTKNDAQRMNALELKENIYTLKVRLRAMLSAKPDVPEYELPPFDEWSNTPAVIAAQSAALAASRMQVQTAGDKPIAAKPPVLTKQQLEVIADNEKHLLEIPSEDLDTNPEFSMLENIVRLLKARHVRALFVFQPVNPEIYKHAMLANIIGRKVSNLLNSAGMQCFDMSDVSHYQHGMLGDGVHLAGLGWLMVDNRMLEYVDQQ